MSDENPTVTESSAHKGGLGLAGLTAKAFVQYPGASTDQVVSLAVEPLERLFAEIPGVKHVYSAAEREQGIITVRFKVGEQMGPSLVKVHDKLQANRQILPPGAMRPMVKPRASTTYRR